MYNYCLLFVSVLSLSWRCDSSEYGDISYTHFLYKEDNVNEVKWLEKNEYCRAKGDTSVYVDAGQGKCEYSRGLCYWDNGCFNTYRDNDPDSECQDLYYGNTLVGGLDNGRLVLQQSNQEEVFTIEEEQPEEVFTIEEEQPEENLFTIDESREELFGQCPVTIQEGDKDPVLNILESSSFFNSPSLLILLGIVIF